MNAEVLQLLIADLDAMDRALDAADYALAGRILVEHDQRLRDCLGSEDLRPAPDDLRAVLDRQHAVTRRMIVLHDHVSAQLRNVRQSGEAARAYREAAA